MQVDDGDSQMVGEDDERGGANVREEPEDYSTHEVKTDEMEASDVDGEEVMVDADRMEIKGEADNEQTISPGTERDANADANAEPGTQAGLAVPAEAIDAASLATNNTSDDKTVTSSSKAPKKKKAKTASTSKKKKVSIQPTKLEEAESGREESILEDQDETERADEAAEEEDDEDDDKLYCICKARFYDDEVRSMLACDSCDEWYHASCMNIDEEKVKFVDQFICCLCEPNTNQRTTMKQPCAREECSGIAPVPLSKYCCQECGVLVAASRVAKIKQGKALSLSKTAEKLLQSPMLLSARKTEGKVVWAPEIDKAKWLESIMGQQASRLIESEVARLGHMQDLAEVEELARLEKRKSRVEAKKNNVNLGLKIVEDRTKLLLRVEDRAGTLELIRDEEAVGDSRVGGKKSKNKKVKQEQAGENLPKAQGQLRCGYDERLSWTNERFYDWSQTAEGQAMIDDDLEKRIPLDGTLSIDGEAESSTEGIKICGQSKRKCKRHADWSLVRGQDMETEKQLQDDLLASLQTEHQEVIRRIEGVKSTIRDKLAMQEKKTREQDSLLAKQLSLQGSRRSTVIHIP